MKPAVQLLLFIFSLQCHVQSMRRFKPRAAVVLMSSCPYPAILLLL